MPVIPTLRKIKSSRPGPVSKIQKEKEKENNQPDKKQTMRVKRQPMELEKAFPNRV
jgi:hypothetical protein